jgi:hypothetical protein
MAGRPGILEKIRVWFEEDMSEEEQFEKQWKEREAGLESLFDKADEMVLHGVIPFFAGIEMGGTPDLISFSNYNDGKLYVTCELVGSEEQKPNKNGQYELAICHKDGEEWGVDIICKLAHYTLDEELNHGETMDIKPMTPRWSGIVAFLFKDIGHFTFFGKPANVVCCIGITKRELKWCWKNGGNTFFHKMPEGYIYTEKKRKSFI